MHGVLAYCRPGFEGECAAELQDKAAALEIPGYCRAESRAGYVTYHPYAPPGTHELPDRLALGDLIFTRQWFVILAHLDNLPVQDRVTPIVAAAKATPQVAGEVFVETPDSDAGKALSRLARGIAAPLRAALEREGILSEADGVRVHVCFGATDRAYVGYAPSANGVPWLGGVPRLRVPREAPSRSTVKLDEALLRFLTEGERRERLRPGMRAVDLGAAPGGWSWYLARRGLHVVAVDNAALHPVVHETGMVEHVRTDAFGYHPHGPVDWLVCDVVERPERVADRVAHWLVRGWCRDSVFNLKLPMKRRYREVRRLMDRLHGRLQGAGVACRLACKHLYHDRDEVTVYVHRG